MGTLTTKQLELLRKSRGKPLRLTDPATGREYVLLNAKVFERLRAEPAARRTSERLIVREPGVCGGKPCVRGKRIPVWLLRRLRDRGESVAAILDAYPILTRAELRAALRHARTHEEETRLAIRASEGA